MSKRAKLEKMADREVMRRALQDAIDWQDSLLATRHSTPNDPIWDECRKLIRNYKRILRDRYGTVERALVEMAKQE